MKTTITLLAAIAAPALASALPVGSELDLTETLKARVIYQNSTNHRVEVYANPDNKPSGKLEIQNTYYIGEEAFTVTQLAPKAFDHCELTDVTVGTDVKTIAEMAFNGCTKLTSFTQSGEPKIEYIGEYAFGYTYALRHANFPAVTDLGNWAFAYSRMESVSMPELKVLGAGAFYDCPNLTTFVGGEKFTSLGNIAFAKCPKLTALTLGPDLTTMGTMALAFNVSLKDLVIPASLVSAGESAFQGSGLERVFILSDKVLDFLDASKLLRNKTIKEIYIDESLVYEIKYYLSVGSDTNPAETLAEAPVLPLTDIIELKALATDRYSAIQKLDGITDLHVINPTTGAEIAPEAGVYTIVDENATLQYRIDSVNLLRYEVKLPGLESGIAQPEINEQRRDEYYTPAGQRIAHPHPGIYIHRPADGTPARLIKKH